MAVTVQAQAPIVTTALVGVAHPIEGPFDHALPGREQRGRNQARITQPAPRHLAVRVDIQRQPGLEPTRCTHRMNAAHETAYPVERLAPIQFRRTSSPTRIDREAQVSAQVIEVMQRDARRICQRRNGRNLVCEQRRDERMFLGDLGIGPATTTVELHHHRVGQGAATWGRIERFLEVDQIDPILVAVERDQPAVTAKPGRLERIEQPIGGEMGTWQAHRVCAGGGCTVPVQAPCIIFRPEQQGRRSKRAIGRSHIAVGFSHIAVRLGHIAVGFILLIKIVHGAL